MNEEEILGKLPEWLKVQLDGNLVRGRTEYGAVIVGYATVTPSRAQELLDIYNLPDNRAIRPSKYYVYSRAMKAGEWWFAGDSLRFDYDGHVIDGQHRLSAQIDSNTDIDYVIVAGLHPEVFSVLDSGLKRQAGDALSRAGYTECNALAGMARHHVRWRQGQYRYVNSSLQRPEITAIEVLDWVEEHGEAPQALREGKHLASLGVGNSLAGMAMLEMYYACGNWMEPIEFACRVSTMSGRGLGDPIATLLMRYKNYGNSRERWNAPYHLFNIFRSWNAFRCGEELRLLKGRSVGSGKTGKGGTIKVPNPI